MSIFKANLKIVLQRPMFWISQICVLSAFVLQVFFISYSSDWMTSSDEDYFSWLVWFYWVPIICVNHYIVCRLNDLLYKPFSYCLPGHRKTLHKVSLFLGMINALLLSIPSLLWPGLTTMQKLAVLLALFSYGLAISFYTLTRSKLRGGFILYIALLLLALVSCKVIFQYLIIYPTFFAAILSIFICASVWLYQSKELPAQKHAEIIISDILGSRIKVQRCKTVPDWIENFFLRRMNNCAYFSTQRNIWGTLYTELARVLVKWRWYIWAILCMSCILSLVNLDKGLLDLFIFIWLLKPTAKLPIQSTMVFPKSRIQRFYSTVAFAAVAALLLGTVAFSVVALSLLLSTIVPNMTLNGITMSFHPIDIRFLWLTLPIIPIAFFVQLFFDKHRNIMLGVLLVAYTSILVTFWFPYPQIAPIGIRVVAILFCYWGLFLCGLRYVCMNRDLVSQTRIEKDF